MIGFFWNVLLALAWAALSGNFSGLNFLFGFVLGYGALALLQRELPILHGYSQRVPRFFMFMGFFAKELLRANLKVAFDVLTPPWHMQPGVIALPIKAETDLEITMLANFISLTPGTLSLDVSTDRRVLFIHAMFLNDEEELLTELREIERRILEIMR
ncbi:Na+/H+ antiporter subunit E [Marinimicrobium sp. ABcell2]|uniref:Na+/H+ antiporter subunit E n=1 Tax=Marinimicrobium sp. ABcell2 TaxID=3069751 RepID=UPI0027B10891|nr:Na+/H+ antiporter subunit E [Marinimicrobium sp. ABcell2]MDQ2077725.1 Na+/H+ antiporter subunit E [Marinimicrobium sp. ABcell2]